MRNGKYHILCVDDDPSVRDWLQIVLEANGYAVTLAESAEAGVARFKEEAPDLIIVDLMMEEVDAGTSLVRDLKAMGNCAPVYMLSSVGDELSENADPGDLGLDGIFQKPLSPEVLLAVLQRKLR